ncbi:MAG: RNA methyltransferase [Phycisphaerales bacterium]|nr:RNA methyltransferase [Phycisphaerales bacterium]
MAHLIEVDELSGPELAPYRDQKDVWLRSRHHPRAEPQASGTGLSGGLFLAEGELVLGELLRSRHEVVSVLVASNKVERLRPMLERLDAATPVFVGSPGVVERVVGYDLHRGVLACGRAAPLPSLEDVLRGARTLVVLENLSNHDNVGGIFRCVRALAGDAGAVLLTPGCCDPLYRRALRVSIGHALHVPWTWLEDGAADISRVAAAGFEVLALTPEPRAVEIGQVGRMERFCLLAGAEGPGLSQAALERASRRVRIGMDPAVDSLNVVVSVGVALHALRPRVE